MRVLMWHGWLLEGSGSNVQTARIARVLTSAGHDVLLLCQERHPERYPWIEAWGTVGKDGPSALASNESSSTASNAPTSPAGRCVLLRPEIGGLLPVFVVDEYEGFDVRRFVDLTPAELDSYLERNVEALRAAAAWHRTELVFAGHAVPGAAIARRAVGPGRYVATVYGSDLEYAIRPQPRYRELAREGLQAARAVVGPTSDVLARCEELVPGIAHLARRVPPGVDVESFRPMPRREALLETASRLNADLDTARGRRSDLDAQVRSALERRDAVMLDDLATRYDQEVPDPDAAARLRALAVERHLIGYLGKLIPQKGVESLLAAAYRSRLRPSTLIVGFGLHREWLVALTMALKTNNVAALAWLRTVGRMPLGISEVERPNGRAGARVWFTGRLDHRYAPGALAAMDILVVPSILPEAFGMVAAEGAAAGALPLVARHSGLSEVAESLEGAVGRPRLLSFEPGPGASGRIAEAIDRLLALPDGEREELREELSRFVAREWSWERAVERLLRAAQS